MAALLGKLADAGVGADAEPDDGPVYLWPECADAWRHFTSLVDQWRDGALPCSEVTAHLAVEVCDADERVDIYRGIRACSRAVADVIREQRKAQLRG